ncbi:MAG: hypothetical protein WBP08_19785, partial [Saprospiraceae bacterium]
MQLKKNTPRLIIAIFSIGLILIQYFSNRGFWLDEVMLALAVSKSSFLQILSPLPHWQVAPIGLLFLEKFLISFIGLNEYVFRLPMLIAALY